MIMDSLSYMVSELELIIKQEQTGSFFPEFIRGCYEVCGVLAISDERTSPFYFSMGCEELVYNPAVLVTLDFHHIVPTTFTITIFSCRLNCPVLPSVDNLGYNSMNTISVVHRCCDISRSKI